MMFPGLLVGPSHYCKNLTSVEAETSCRTSISLARLALVQFHHTAVCSCPKTWTKSEVDWWDWRMVTELKGTCGEVLQDNIAIGSMVGGQMFLRRQEVGLLHSAGFQSAGNKLHLSTMCLLSCEQVLENDFVL